MISKSELKYWYEILDHCANTSGRTCVFFIDTKVEKSELYEKIPNSIKAIITVNFSTHTIYFDNDSRIIIERAGPRSMEKLKGIKIDVAVGYELLDNKSREELLIVCRMIIREDN